MERLGLVLIAIVLTIGLLVIPIWRAIVLWIDRPPQRQEGKLTNFWRNELWCWPFILYGLFTVPTTYYVAFCEHIGYVEIGSLAVSYIAPWVYLIPSFKTYNLTNKGLLLLFGWDACDINRGFWFIPEFIGRTVVFTVDREEYQFPSDSIGEEHDKEIRISTGQHLVTHTSKEDNTTHTKILRASEMTENGVLSKIIMLVVSPMVVFRFTDPRRLFQNYSDIYLSDGQVGVSAEIARQIRDIIVSEATSMFPQYTAEEILHKLTEINDKIKEKVLHDVADWGIELLEAKFVTINFDAAIQTYLDSLIKQNTDAIGALLKAQEQSEAYKKFTQARQERADALAGPNGDKLALVLQLEAAVELAKNSTNVNVGDLGGLGMAALVKMISGHAN